MTELKQIYKCEICGNIVEIINNGSGKLVCCGQPMKLLEENTIDAALEKHVPVIEKIEDGVLVKIGEVQHPMVEKHYIQWIELHTENKIYRKFLNPGEKPEAIFNVDLSEVKYAREYCNIHGLWRKDR